MLGLLYDPVSEIKKCKNAGYGKILLYLLAASLFATVGLLFFTWRFFPKLVAPDVVIQAVFLVLFAIMLAKLIAAFFFALSLHVLDGKGGYFDGLAAVVLGMIGPAMAIFFAGAVVFIPYGLYPAALILTYGLVLGLATLFRSAKEFFNLDYSGVLIGFLIAVLPVALACCALKFLL